MKFPVSDPQGHGHPFTQPRYARLTPLGRCDGKYIREPNLEERSAGS